MQLTFEEARRAVEKMADSHYYSLYYNSAKHFGVSRRVTECTIYYRFENYTDKTWAAALKKLKSSIKK